MNRRICLVLFSLLSCIVAAGICYHDLVQVEQTKDEVRAYVETATLDLDQFTHTNGYRKCAADIATIFDRARSKTEFFSAFLMDNGRATLPRPRVLRAPTGGFPCREHG
jgi:hypothetical protein